jgi:hypothetical protein
VFAFDLFIIFIMFFVFFVFILVPCHKSRESVKIGPHPRGHPSSEIFSELDESKPEPPIFPNMRGSPKESWRGPGGHHTTWWRG